MKKVKIIKLKLEFFLFKVYWFLFLKTLVFEVTYLLSNHRPGGGACPRALWQGDGEAPQPSQPVCVSGVRCSNSAGRTPTPRCTCTARRFAEDAGGHDTRPVSHMTADMLTDVLTDTLTCYLTCWHTASDCCRLLTHERYYHLMYLCTLLCITAVKVSWRSTVRSAVCWRRGSLRFIRRFQQLSSRSTRWLSTNISLTPTGKEIKHSSDIINTVVTVVTACLCVSWLPW